jgi:periplasmic protein TonB
MRLHLIAVGIALAVVSPTLAQQDDTIYEPGNGVSMPKLVKEVGPRYTADALRRGVTGAVMLQCVVDRKGVPTNPEVVQSLDDELDKIALKALRQWRFEPGKKDGKAVLVRVQVNMAFKKNQRR